MSSTTSSSSSSSSSSDTTSADSSGGSSSDDDTSSGSSSNSDATETCSNFEINGSYINMIPSMKVSDLLSIYSNISVVDSSGKILESSDLVGTGSVITIDGESYTAIKLGDANGDGYVDTGDTFIAKQIVVGVKEVSGVYKIAIDVNKDGYIDTGDTYKLKKHVIGTETIKL